MSYLVMSYIQGVGADYYVPNNDAPSAFESINHAISWNATRGYYSDANPNWSTVTALVTIPNLANVRRITATFTGYYNTPSNSAGQNFIQINYSDTTSVKIGTWDGSEVAANGQYVYLGDSGSVGPVTVDYIDETATATTPVGETITSIEFISTLPSNPFPPSNRGIKDIIAKYS